MKNTTINTIDDLVALAVSRAERGDEFASARFLVKTDWDGSMILRGDYMECGTSKEFGAAILGVFKKKIHRGRERAVGTMTLSGILTRLGRADAKQLVADAVARGNAGRSERERAYRVGNIIKRLDYLSEDIAVASKSGHAHDESAVEKAIAVLRENFKNEM